MRCVRVVGGAVAAALVLAIPGPMAIPPAGAADEKPALAKPPAAVPTQVTEGVIRLRHGDPFVTDEHAEPADESVVLDHGAGTPNPIALSTKAAGQLAGKRVRVTGSVRDGELQPTQRVQTLGSDPADLDALAVPGPRTVALILVNFQDDTSEPWTTAQAEDVVLDADRSNPRSVRAYYEEVSDATATLSGATLGWYPLPLSSTSCDVDAIASAGNAAATADATEAGLDLTSASVYKVYAFPATSACGWAGLANLPGDRSWINGFLDLRVVSHELGHNFGVHHASTATCTDASGNRVAVSARLFDDCAISEYGDPFTVMGTSDRRTHHAWHRRQLGFPMASTTVTVGPGYDVTHTLTALEPDPAGSALRLLRVTRGSTGTYLDLELRGASGSFDDFTLGEPAISGVTARVGWEDDVRSQSQQLDANFGAGGFSDAPLGSGASLWDPASGVRVTVVSVGAGEAVVRLQSETDTTPPASPSNLVAQPEGNSIVLSWTGSTDNRWVGGYEIRRDDVRVGVARGTQYVDPNLVPGQSYSYEVFAYDAAGLASASVITSATARSPHYSCFASGYSWIDPTIGTAHPLGDDAAVTVALPFSLPFYGTPASTVAIASNGFVRLDGGTSSSLSNVAIPSTDDPNGFAAPFFDDLNPAAGGSVWTRTVGSVPNRQFVVGWVGVPRYGVDATNPLTFELVLDEAAGAITFQYQDVQVGDPRYDRGASATVGIEHPTAITGIQISFDQPVLEDSSAYRCTPPPPNDAFADRRTITGSTGEVTGANVGATKEPGEPAHVQNAGGASVWYSWTAPAAGMLSVSTAGSAFDTLLAAYTGSNVAALIGIAGNDDANGTLQSAIGPLAVTSGTRYRIAVDGFNGASGPIALSWSFARSARTVSAANCAAPEAVNCAFVLTLSSGSTSPVTVDYTTLPGTAGPGDFVAMSGTAVFAPGVTSQTVTVPLVDDDATEPNEQFSLVLSSALGASLGANGIGTIQDGTVVYAIGFQDDEANRINQAAAFFGEGADALRFSARVLRFIDFLSQPQGIGPISPVPTSSGPVSFTARYTQEEDAAMRALSSRLGISIESYHVLSVRVVVFIWMLSRP